MSDVTEITVTFPDPIIDVIEVEVPDVIIDEVEAVIGVKGDQGDPGQGVAIGGSTGQVLTKSSDDDYDTEWTDESSGGVSIGLAAGLAIALG